MNGFEALVLSGSDPRNIDEGMSNAEAAKVITPISIRLAPKLWIM
jgi:hypothetical protein